MKGQDKRMLKNMKRQLNQMYDVDGIDAEFYWKYENDGGDIPELRMEVTLEFTIPEENFDVCNRKMEELKDSIKKVVNPDSDIRMGFMG